MTQRIPPKIGQLRNLKKKKEKKRKQVNMRLKVVFLFFTFCFVDAARVRNIPHGQVDTQRHLLPYVFVS